ncbi:PREDICTED: E3 ubiquitin-protein ligase TRAIP-like isoform X2 [Dinoponera quadriceps]|uniref:E3 ubiquitin-protein ligase TRAIP-like isoform X2 n=1 Tax=Dinoponera quadriceps TaxID=609295 RepID=A0A6P3Y9M4_DINQU|nr:PREDICTED: E3 ubiquitin-protein ligase TRAIP-like isoform X2 [Dinoponera quadriceps]
MYIVCTICRDNFIQSDDISVTPCGHVFHLNCLSRWLMRSNSCPECREETSQEKIQRLYVTFVNNETSSADSLSTQERIDSLKFQVMLNERNIKYYTTKSKTLEKQNAGLRQEVRKVESEMNKKNSTIYLLKEQMKTLKEKYMEHEALKCKLSQKEKEIENLKIVKTLLHGSVIDAEEAAEKTDRDTLIAYVKAMKRDMSTNAKQWELLYKHTKKCHSLLAEIDSKILITKTTRDKEYINNMTDTLHGIYKMEKLITSNLKACKHFGIQNSIPNGQKKLYENSPMDVQETNAKQETRTMMGTMVNNSANQEKCPISKKRMKLVSAVLHVSADDNSEM